MYSYMGEKRKKAAQQFASKTGKGLLIGVVVSFLAFGYTYATQKIVSCETIRACRSSEIALNIPEPRKYQERKAYITGYNTTRGQTDNTPCISASGDNICGRTDVVACPRGIKLGTKVEIRGKEYTCLDRTSSRYDGRFDISCDKDMKCPSRVTGWANVKIY